MCATRISDIYDRSEDDVDLADDEWLEITDATTLADLVKVEFTSLLKQNLSLKIFLIEIIYLIFIIISLNIFQIKLKCGIFAMTRLKRK